MNIFRLKKTYKSARRLQQIINVFLRHGFGRIIDQIHLGRLVPFRKRLKVFGQWPELRGPSVPERLRTAFEEMGPTFIKLAQILSSRPDLVTESYAREFRRLQDNVPPFGSAEARSIIEEELGRPVVDVFTQFTDAPLAAASIAQVHAATLAPGREVIVKVQRPGIREVIMEDIEIISALAELLERHIPESRFFNPTGIVQEFSRTIRREMDFAEEARSCVRIRRNLEGNARICVPEIFAEVSTDKVLVMERIRGTSIDETAEIDRLGGNRPELARSLVDAYFQMILRDGFFHADPHPGNLFFLPPDRICFTDFGMVGRVSEESKEALAGTLHALVKRDYESLIEHYIDLGYLPEDVDAETFRREFKADLVDFLDPLIGRSIREVNVAQCMDAFVEIATRHHLMMPHELLLINKTLFHIDTIVRCLDPEFNLVEAAEPYAVEILKRRFEPRRAAHRIARAFSEAGEAFLAFPGQMNKLLKKSLRDDLRFKISLTGLDHLIKDMDRSSNRIAFALVVSSIILSSALMHAMGTGPKVFGLSILGIVTFVVAFFLGVWLLISIIRSGRL